MLSRVEITQVITAPCSESNFEVLGFDRIKLQKKNANQKEWFPDTDIHAV
jgi:hypothetical protein